MIALYKKGDTHNAHGIECEILRCKAKELDFYLSKGYVKDPKELLENKPEAPIDEVVVHDELENEDLLDE